MITFDIYTQVFICKIHVHTYTYIKNITNDCYKSRNFIVRAFIENRTLNKTALYGFIYRIIHLDFADEKILSIM